MSLLPVLAVEFHDSDFREMDGEWRIRDVALGRNLGFSVDVDIRKAPRAAEISVAINRTIAKIARGELAIGPAPQLHKSLPEEIDHEAALVIALAKTRELKAKAAELAAANARIADLEPQAKALAEFSEHDGEFKIREAAKALGFGPNRFVAMLREEAIRNY